MECDPAAAFSEPSKCSPAAAPAPQLSNALSEPHPELASSYDSDVNPAAAFSPSESGSDMSPSAAFADSDDDSEVDPDRAFSPPPNRFPGPFTSAHFAPIREEDLEPSESDKSD
jgi:hypothetical protein